MRDTVWVTLVFPRELWEEVKRLIPPGERSRVIAEATRLELKWITFEVHSEKALALWSR